MKARSSMISMVMVWACACVVVEPADDDVGDATDSDATDSGATGSDSTGSDSTGSDSTGSDSTGSDSTGSDTTDTDTTDTGVPPDSCEGIGSSDLPGVCIWFPSPGHSFTLAEVADGIAVPYQVIVEADVPEVVPLPQDDGGCGQKNESGLIVFAVLQGNGEQYCVCDFGLCPLAPEVGTVPAGNTPLQFEWNGVNWHGPSDTNNPFGPAFPIGEYTLEISAVGTVSDAPFEVRNSFAVTLTE